MIQNKKGVFGLFSFWFAVFGAIFIFLLAAALLNVPVQKAEKKTQESVFQLRLDQKLNNYLSTPLILIRPETLEKFSLSKETTFLDLILQMEEHEGGRFTGLQDINGYWNNQFDGWEFVRVSEQALGQEILSFEIKKGDTILLDWTRSGLFAGGNKITSQRTFKEGYSIVLKVAARE